MRCKSCDHILSQKEMKVDDELCLECLAISLNSANEFKKDLGEE